MNNTTIVHNMHVNSERRRYGMYFGFAPFAGQCNASNWAESTSITTSANEYMSYSIGKVIFTQVLDVEGIGISF